MATGGPFIDPRATPSVDEALAPIVAEATTSTTGAPPPIPPIGDPAGNDAPRAGGGMPRITVDQPEWAWRPTQQDFGQVDLRRGNYDTGMVPTVQVQMPFSALANRQQAAANRRAALEQKVAAFDPYGGLKDAADPYNINFGKLARSGMDQFVKEVADSMYGGDMREAYRGIATDPQLQSMYKSRAAEYNEVGSMSKTLLKDALDKITAYEAGEVDLSPDALEAAYDMVNGIGQFGGPKGPDVTKLVQQGRKYESVQSREAAYKDWVVNSGLKEAMQTIQAEGRIDRTKGGLIRLTETEERNWNGLKDRVAQDWARKGIGGTYDENMEWLNKTLPTSVVTETDLRAPSYPPSSGSGNAPSEQPGAYTVTYSKLPQAVFNRKDVKTGKTIERLNAPGSEMEFPSLTLFNMSSDQATFPRAYDFKSGGGEIVRDSSGKVLSETSKSERVTAHPTDIVNINNKLFIVGRKTTQPRASAKSSSGGGMPTLPGASGGEDDIQDFNQLEVIMIPYEGNEAIVEAGFGLSDSGIRQTLLPQKARVPKQPKPASSPAENSWY